MDHDKTRGGKDHIVETEVHEQVGHDHGYCHGNDDVMKNLQAVRAVVEMLEASELSELAYAWGDFSVRAVKTGSGVMSFSPVSQPVHSVAVDRKEESPTADARSALSLDYVTSPMVGTVYLAPKPGDSQFITLDSMVQEGQPLLIIEAMKTMNVIKAPKSGKVLKIFVENGAPVEFGQPLVHIQ